VRKGGRLKRKKSELQDGRPRERNALKREGGLGRGGGGEKKRGETRRKGGVCNGGGRLRKERGDIRKGKEVGVLGGGDPRGKNHSKRE